MMPGVMPAKMPPRGELYDAADADYVLRAAHLLFSHDVTRVVLVLCASRAMRARAAACALMRAMCRLPDADCRATLRLFIRHVDTLRAVFR